jgi:hypothetical protein
MADPVANLGPVEMRDRTPIAIRTDNLIRQRLRIGDPNKPEDVAEGLKRRFPKGAQILASEALGRPLVPFAYGTPVVRAPESLATSAEMRQAVDDVERDVAALLKDHRLKDIEPELEGWGQAVRSIISDGMAAARLALDPLARDRLFGARRQLGDYARLARMVGALTQTLNVHYRRFAQSLDSAASLMLVLAGEVLAGAGLGGGRFLLSVPASELQSRRDSVLLALRNLSGTTQQAYGNDQWPWGLHGFREVLQLIERSGHLDLRSLLEEPVLGKLMDELIERAAQHTIIGLRQLGSTAELAVQRLHRLLNIVDNNVVPPSPPVLTLLKAIQLFLDAFTASRSGYRLLFIARAPIGFYGLTGIGGPDRATRRLLDLVLERGRFAELLDCYLGCECCSDDVICQILLDKLLYDTDRAIDLYTLGSNTNGRGEPEWRAAAFGLLFIEFLNQNPRGGSTGCLVDGCFPRLGELFTRLERIRDLLCKDKLIFESGAIIGADPGNAHRDLLTSELCLQELADRRLEALIETLAPGCIPSRSVLGAIGKLIAGAVARVEQGHTCEDPEIVPPPTVPTSLRIFDTIANPVDEIVTRLRRNSEDGAEGDDEEEDED